MLSLIDFADDVFGCSLSFVSPEVAADPGDGVGNAVVDASLGVVDVVRAGAAQTLAAGPVGTGRTAGDASGAPIGKTPDASLSAVAFGIAAAADSAEGWQK
jgi:isocitrate/isopropylmalate dehydrogenase